jgi:hypothetical protein
LTPTTAVANNNAIASSAGGNGGVWYCDSAASAANPAVVQAATCTKLTTISLLGNNYSDMVDVDLGQTPAGAGTTTISALLTAANAGPVASVATPSQTLPTTYSYINTNPFAWTSVDLNILGTASLFTTAAKQYLGSLVATGDTQDTTNAWADANFVLNAAQNTFGAVGGNVNPGLFSGFAAATVITVTGQSLALTWSGIATSADGTVVVGGTTTKGLYISTNSGYTWTQIATFPDLSGVIVSVACDSDCSVIVACTATIIYTSTNSGGSWVAITPTVSGTAVSALKSVTSNADGTKMYAATGTGNTADQYIFASTNAGASWLAAHASGERRAWASVDTDSVGTKVLASATQYVFTSANSASTFAQSLDMGASATPIVTLAGTGLSAAAGDSFGTAAATAGLRTAVCDAAMTCTWTVLVAPGTAGQSTWTGLDMTADGARLAAVNSGSSTTYNGRVTYTYGLPTASVWQQTTKVAGTASQAWPGIAIADNAARVYAAGGAANQVVQVGSGQA